LLQIVKESLSSFDRGSALDALGNIASPKLVEACAIGLEDADPYVRQCAVEHFARSGDARDRLAQMIELENVPRVRCALAAALLESEESSC